MTPELNNRDHRRANVFLTASMEVAGDHRSVRLRNISSQGVMIDGTPSPKVGTKIKLFRGRLKASGTVVWRHSMRFGIAFDQMVDAEAWGQRISHAGQQGVDELIAAVRQAGRPQKIETIAETVSLASIADDLARVSERIADLPNLSLQLGYELVRLDVIVQKLRTLEGRIV